MVARLLAGLLLLALLVSLAPLASAAGASLGLRTLTYEGEQFQVPSSWPVYDLGRSPGTCVRFNRHAAYLGAPQSASSCPAQVFGTASAIEVEPATGTILADASRADRLRSTSLDGQSVLLSSNSEVSGRIVAAFPQTGILATISYRTAAGHKRALSVLRSFRLAGLPTSPATARTGGSAGSTTSGPTSTAASRPPASAVRLTASTTQVAAHTASVTANGEGFDTCDAPNESQMAAWYAHSPFRSVGVYIGGPNAACFNVTSSWISTEATAGWDIFPIYVGLQAPCANQPNLASISSNLATAASQGAADAQNAVINAASLGIGPGATLYDDMEAWNTGSGACNNAVISFVKAWTDQLHADGYDSGVYASLYSGVSVLQSIYGQAGAPDVLYFAYWDNVATTLNGAIPSSQWPSGHRIKQYASGTWTYGGVSLNIDEDYLNAPAVGAPTPALQGVAPLTAPAGTTVIIRGANLNVGATTVRFGSVPSPHVQVLSPSEILATVPAPTTASSSAGPSVPVSVETGVGTATSAAVGNFTYANVTAIAASPAGGYLVTSSAGNVLNYHARYYGAPLSTATAPVVAVADTKTGYLLATSKGNVYNYNTPWYGSVGWKALPSPVVGMASTATGYLLVTAAGNVYNFHTGWYGSMAGRPLPAPVVGIAATSSGYLLVTAKGNVYNFHTGWYGSTSLQRLSSPMVGIAATSSGYLLTTAAGNVYNYNTTWYGSPASEAAG